MWWELEGRALSPSMKQQLIKPAGTAGREGRSASPTGPSMLQEGAMGSGLGWRVRKEEWEAGQLLITPFLFGKYHSKGPQAHFIGCMCQFHRAL